MQAHLEPGGHAGAGEYVAFLDVEHGAVDLNFWVALGEFASVHPVRGSPPTVVTARGPSARHLLASASVIIREASDEEITLGPPKA
jgi:hypothetical protein